MSKFEKLLLKILKETSDKNIEFKELCSLLNQLESEGRTRGDHHFLLEITYPKLSICSHQAKWLNRIR